MKTYLDCYSCFLRQALHAARMAQANETQQLTIMRRTLALLQTLSPEQTSPEIGYAVHKIVREVADHGDPYREAKVRSTHEALALYPHLKTLGEESENELETAVRLSIAGNIIDFGPTDHVQGFDLWETVERVLAQPFAIDHLAQLRLALTQVNNVLYLTDNAGETVFDRLLIEVLPIPVTYVVKGGPTLNDATLEDALAAGVDSCATDIITNGADAPGTILGLCSDDFRKVFEAAPLIIAKGQANYETLSTAGARVFCLLQAKCPIIARDLGAAVGDIVVRQST